MDDLVKRLRDPKFGTETTERNLMKSAADRIEELEAKGLANRVAIMKLEAKLAAARKDALREVPAEIGGVSVREAARVLLGDRWRGYENKDAREAMWDHVHDVHGRHMLPMSAYSGVLIAALRAIAEGKDDE